MEEHFERVGCIAGIEEHILKSNGLKVLTVENHASSTVVVMITYLVGSRNEGVGYTGSTHILEHLMFKGSKKFNKESGTSVWTVLQTLGASINATTWNDRTNYYENLPSEHLSAALELEADRMRGAFIKKSDLDSEMTVVRNEYERGENDPEQALDKHIWASAYAAHPYHHPTIGWWSDIENVPIERLREFYNTFYHPNNAVLTLVGDFVTHEALGLVKEHFGGVERSVAPIPQMYTKEFPQQGARRVIVKRSGEVGMIGIAFKVPGALHPDSYALRVLDKILSTGKNSRLYKALVDPGFASKVSVDHCMFQDHTLFVVYVTLTTGTTHEAAEAIVLGEYEKIKAKGVTKEQVAKAKARIRSQVLFSRDGPMAVARGLNGAIAAGDWRSYATLLPLTDKVTPAHVQEVTQRYFVPDQSTTGYFIPEKAVKPEDDVITGEPGARKVSFDDVAKEQEAETKTTQKPPGTTLEERVVTSQPLPGLDLLTLETGVDQVVSISASLLGGRVFANEEEGFCVPSICAGLLDQGTAKRTKFEISSALEEVGASLNFSQDPHRLEISGRCLKEDTGLLIELMAEQLRCPLFDQGELDTYVKRRVGRLQRENDMPRNRAERAWKAAVYPKGHPWHRSSVEEEIKATAAMVKRREDIVAFHQRVYGLGNMIVVAVGDVDHEQLAEALKKGFAGWKTSSCVIQPPVQPCVPSPGSLFVNMENKTSLNLFIGSGVGIRSSHPDWYALQVGVFALGGNFSARLMRTVRDEQGLTYGIGAGIGGGSSLCDGYWRIAATFAPKLLEKGRSALMEQVDKWWKEGITEEELEAKKTTLIGQYRVHEATTSTMARRLRYNKEEDRELSWLDEYCGKIQKLTLSDVNAAIKKYIHLEKMFEACAGSKLKE